MPNVIIPTHFEYTTEVEELIALLEENDIEIGWGELGEVIIDFLENELSHFSLVHRYHCNRGRATRLLMLLNRATGKKVPVTSQN